jgi:hypothetical protein
MLLAGFAVACLWFYHVWLYGPLLGVISGLIPAMAIGLLVFVGIRCRLPAG